MRTESKDGSKFVTDEVFNTASHLSGSMAALLGMVILIVKSSYMGDPWKIVSFSIYGVTLLMVFFASTMHHGINSSKKIEQLLRLFDYIAIFPLIAGTFTPLCLVKLRTPIGWAVFGVIWALAIIGIVVKSVFPQIPKWATNTIYISMGWIGGILAIPLFPIIGVKGFLLLLFGGIFYSSGTFIYYNEKPNPIPGKFGFHEIWHIFVIFGALSHYLLMYFFVL
ncbi:MAG TPA: hemolysin III family protein [Spirochaetota bacterium]|nr:hemolysin III family protein [Spirochaetota bacterium]